MILDKKKKPPVGTKGTKNLEVETKRVAESKGPAAMITSEEWQPISQKTYQFETRRKKSTTGYRISGGKYFKSKIVVK